VWQARLDRFAAHHRKYRPRNLDRGRGQRWRTFVRNHLAQIWACDFFTIVSLRFHVFYGS
jgi:hypothetical protein